MGSVKLDYLTTLEAYEKNGVVQRLVRLARVIGLNKDDYTVLYKALDELDDTSGKAVKVGESPDDFPNLVLTERNLKIVSNSPSKVDVELVYENSANAVQDLDSGNVIYGKMRSNLQQIQTNKDMSIRPDGIPIMVSHTFPDGTSEYLDHVKVPLPRDRNRPGQTEHQGGEITVYTGERTFAIEGYKRTTTPWVVLDGILGKVNDGYWLGKPSRTWLCTSVNYEPYLLGGTPGTTKYLFTIEFQHNPDTWDPTVVFIDPETGKPPVGLIKGVGYKTIEYYESVDFEKQIAISISGDATETT